MLRRDLFRLFPPILLSDGDQLTYGSACQIIEHNVTVYCETPEAAPPGFPASKLCKPGVNVCREVLGDPQPAPAAPPPRANSV